MTVSDGVCKCSLKNFSLRGQKSDQKYVDFSAFFSSIFLKIDFLVDFSRDFVENRRKSFIFSENHRKTCFLPRSELKNACFCTRLAPQAKILGNIREKFKFSSKNLSVFLVLSAAEGGRKFFCLSLGGIVTTNFRHT